MPFYDQQHLLKQYLSNLQTNILITDINKVPRNWGNTNFVPECNKFYFIMEGEGWLSIDGSCFYPKPGELYLIPAGVTQSHATISNCTLLKYWCHFNAMIGEINLFEMLKTPFVIQVKDKDTVNKLFQDLVNYHQSDDLIASIKAKAVLLELVYYYLSHSGIEQVNLKSSLSHEKVETVVKYMERNLSNDITVEDLAKVVHLHPNYFHSNI
ncbi:AraC family transcriptional regulator [Bacillus sp. FSL K6-3431]|uniref:AraC family transcriptional regulator n=1 Tax=Bacillus sp. FSL K6-3431 TaxID=2921500 RepID=UPI0030F78382